MKKLATTMMMLASLAMAANNDARNRIVNDPLVGTWAVKVPGPTPADTFYALHTFHADGTFTENSSLLPTLVEGPAQGVWVRDGDIYRLTFLLFRYNEEKGLDGYVRVRCDVTLVDNRIDATTAVDLIEKDGSIIESVATGPFFGLRQKVEGATAQAATPVIDEVGKSSPSGDRALSGRDALNPGASSAPRAGNRWMRLMRR
jgi:hypothetical protein